MDCQPCKSKPGSCRARNLTYQITCQNCQEKGIVKKYLGESHRAWSDRCSDHMQALKNGNQDYAIVKHQLNDHPDEEPNFKFLAVKSFKSAMQRQIYEAIMIDEAPNSSLMNGKAEWGQNRVPRVKVQKEVKEDGQPGQVTKLCVGQKELPKAKRLKNDDDHYRQLTLPFMQTSGGPHKSSLTKSTDPLPCDHQGSSISSEMRFDNMKSRTSRKRKND